MPKTGRIGLIALVWAALAADSSAVRAFDLRTSLIVAAAENKPEAGSDKEQTGSRGENSGKMPEMTPEQKMQARFPQPAKVSHLIGLPVLDWNDSTIGYVQQVVRAPDGKIQLIVPYGKWFGWARSNLLGWARRPVAIPIEVVAILALQINAIDMDREEFDKAPTWIPGRSEPIPPDQTVKIALGRR